LNLTANEDISDTKAVKDKLAPLFEAYRKMYGEYYTTCKQANSPAMRDANPVIILYPGIGLFSFAKDKQTARKQKDDNETNNASRKTNKTKPNKQNTNKQSSTTTIPTTQANP
jgi:rhamnose utilization protein RhaD (predicted bifunctional aldolase and dehydrogenase)